MSIYNDIIEIIQKSTYKLTPQREKIVEILVENSELHLSAEELYFILKEKITFKKIIGVCLILVGAIIISSL